MDKAELRKEILEKRKELSHEEAERKSKVITDKLKREKRYINAKTMMFYASKGKEVMTHEIIKEAMKTKRVILPKVHEKGMLCCQLNDFAKMEFNCYGILEPKDEIVCDVSEIELIIVPGVVFDKQGNRIGYGKGYYDGLLKKAKAYKIGLAYDFQIVDKISTDEWDVKVDMVVSD